MPHKKGSEKIDVKGGENTDIGKFTHKPGENKLVR